MRFERDEDNRDQPPEVDVHDPGRQLPPTEKAAERVREYLCWFGDGEVSGDHASGPPLYARDLEVLVRAAETIEAVPTGAASVIQEDNQ
jgi:hypothetical protein